MRDNRSPVQTHLASRRARRLLLTTLMAVVALLLGSASAARAQGQAQGQAHGQASVHHQHTVAVAGVVFTTATVFGPTSVTIGTAATPQSQVSPLGTVSLHQVETVVMTTLQVAGPPPVPAAGTISITQAELTAVHGKGSLRYTSGPVSFTTLATVTEAGGLHPIVFSGDLSVTGGSGRLAGAHGALHYVGEYSFTNNAGFFVIWGTVSISR